ncbi:retrovirus-related pol polyprotein from transposon TNT 1-94 [Tanacetum coccineum]
MLAVCNLAAPNVPKAPKPSSIAERVPQGTKPGAIHGHKKQSTSSKQPSVSSREATKGGSSKAPTDSKTGYSQKIKESSLAMDLNPSQPLISTPVDTEMHKEDQQAAGGPSSLGATSEEGAHLQLSSASHNFASCLPTELKELPSSIVKFLEEIKELRAVRDMEIELPGDLVEIPTKLETFTSTISVFHPRFSTMVGNASRATSMHVPSAGQAADFNLLREKNPKLMILKRKKIHKIINCEVLTKKGPITLKIYKEDGSDEVILNIKVSDLHSAEWREVLQACPDKSEEEWKTIYDLVKTRVDQLTQTKQELKIDLNQPLKEQDHLNELIDLANKKRKRTSDLRDHSSPSASVTEVPSALALQVLRRLGSIFTSMYVTVHKLKKDSWLELQFSLADNSKLNVLFSYLYYQDFQDSLDDEKDTRSSHEYLNDLEEEYQAIALLDKSKRFFKRVLKILMALAEENDVVSKEGARNGEWVKISMRKLKFYLPIMILVGYLPAEIIREKQLDPFFLLVTDPLQRLNYDSVDESSVCSTPLPPLKKLDGAEPISGPKTIKSILRSKSTFKAETLKGVIINEPSSALAKDNKSSSASKVNSAPAGKLKSVKIEDDPPLAIVIKELNNLKLQFSKSQSSYSRSNQPLQCDIRKPIWYLDSGCSRHMTGVKSYLHKYVEQPGPKVVFGDDSTCTTEGYGSIKCNGIVFTKVAFVDGLKYNLISISQLCDAKYIIQFDEKRGTIFNSNKEVVMIAPRGKHHRASFKTKQTSSIKKCLHLLHMDLFGPVTPRSINHEKYTLVIVDEYSRYTWVYFLKKKSQAPETIMSFIKRVENQNDIKVKQLRTDNGTEFRNSILVNFCDEKGISQNFSSPYTPEQNGVAERKNRTLIEAARTMLSGSVFSKQYWTEAVATACYTQNRSTIVKRHLKTPYFYIHNHKDHLGKFDEKADDGYLLGYSLVSKAFRVFNTRRQQTEETYHVTFDESPYAIKFKKPSVDNINIAENERYPPDEYLHPYEPSQRYQTNRNDVSFIEPYESPEPVVLETEVSSDQNG